MNQFLTLGYRLSRMVWKIFRPVTIGVRLIITRDDSVLLVKPSYQSVWTLPGGGAEPGETLEQTARREAREEVGLEIGELGFVGIFSNFDEDKSDHIVVFAAQAGEIITHHTPDVEIESVQYFSPDQLPAAISPGARRRIEAYRGGVKGPKYGTW